MKMSNIVCKLIQPMAAVPMTSSSMSVVVVCFSQLRRFRTMSELLLDAKQWAKHPWNAFGKKVVGISHLVLFIKPPIHIVWPEKLKSPGILLMLPMVFTLHSQLSDFTSQSV